MRQSRYLAVPNMEDYAYMKEKAIDRLGRDWDTDRGWGERMPQGFYYRFVQGYLLYL